MDKLTGLARALILSMLFLPCAAERACADVHLPDSALIGGVALGATTRGYGQLSLHEAIDQIRRAGAQVIEIQFGQTLSPQEGDAVVSDAMTEEQTASLRRKISSSSAKLVAAKVRFSANQSANRRLFEWAHQIGIQVLVGDPPSEQFDFLERMIREFNISVALVTGPRAGAGRDGWTDPKAIMRTLRGRDPRFQVVLNLLNLVRAGVEPFQALDELRTRVGGIQVCDLSDLTPQARPVPFGEGQFDFRRLLTALDAMSYRGYLALDWPAEDPAFQGDTAKAVAFVEEEMSEIRRVNLLRLSSREAIPATGLHYEVLALGGLPEPIAVQTGPEGSVWIGGRRGELWSWSPAQRTHSILGRVDVNTTGHRGLYGFVLDPGFATNGYLYLHRAPMLAVGNSNRVSRFHAAATAGSWRLTPGSERILLEVPSATHGLMQGGGFLLHPGDGCLYIGTGDNNRPEETVRFFDDPLSTAQNLGDLRGKILRLQTDGSIPKDNPFLRQNEARPEIHAFGLRNPFSLSLDPATGRVFVGDVGFDRAQDWEEIDLLQAGANYGWPRCDGRNRDTLADTPCPLPGAVGPWFGYPHESASSVVVGPYLGGKPPAGWPARYSHGLVYADFSRRTIRFAQVDPSRNVVTNTIPIASSLGGGPTSMTLSPEGDLLITEYAGWLAGNPQDRLSRITVRPPLHTPPSTNAARSRWR